MSIINGQRKQALKQLLEDGYKLSDLTVELVDRNMVKEIPVMIRLAEDHSIISYHPANLRSL